MEVMFSKISLTPSLLVKYEVHSLFSTESCCISISNSEKTKYSQNSQSTATARDAQKAVTQR